MSPENTPSEFRNRTHRWRGYLPYAPHIVSAIAFIIFLIMYINTCKDIYFEFKSGNSSRDIEALQDTNKIFGTFVTISGIALLLLFSKQLVNIFMKHKYIISFLITVFSIFIPVLLSIFKVIGNPMELIMVLVAVICGIPGLAQFMQTQFMQSFNKEKREESGIQKNVSNSSPEFIQENSPTTIQENSPTTIQENSSASIYNNSPISIQNNNNSPISIQNNVTNVTNLIDEQSERERITTDAHKNLNAKDLPSRISAVKTLANMADSWLKDSPNCKKDEKKCQDIIDVLCTYIRSSFPLAEDRREIESSTSNRYTSADRQTLHNEQEVRRLIFEEISLRLSTLDDNLNIHQGRWSKFKFNFSGSPIFYNLNALTLEQIDIWQLKFFGDINFENSIFIHKFVFPSGLETNISLKGATFCSDAAFEHAGFFGEVNFSDTTFLKDANFEGARFGSGLSDLRNNELDRSLPRYVNQLSPANFKNVEFHGEAIFYGARFRKDTYFDNAKFMDEVDFRDSNSREELSFKEAVFKKNVYFSDMQCRVNINFTEAIFSESITRAKFSSTHITHKNICTSTVPAGLLDFSNGKYIDPQYSWSCLPIPSGARMALSDSWDEKKKNYVKGSSPAR